MVSENVSVIVLASRSKSNDNNDGNVASPVKEAAPSALVMLTAAMAFPTTSLKSWLENEMNDVPVLVNSGERALMASISAFVSANTNCRPLLLAVLPPVSAYALASCADSVRCKTSSVAASDAARIGSSKLKVSVPAFMFTENELRVGAVVSGVYADGASAAVSCKPLCTAARSKIVLAWATKYELVSDLPTSAISLMLFRSVVLNVTPIVRPLGLVTDPPVNA